MAQSHDLGRIGEDLAVERLKEKGYKILKRNWRSGRTEIDIIAENSEFIVFVEVKTRTEEFKEDLKDAINRNKQRAIVFAADNYIKWNKIDKEGRFDVVKVVKQGDDFIIEHTPEAFYSTLR